jgi:hypothetical protein
MKPVVGLAIIAAVLGAVFYLYTTLTPRTGAQYAQAKDMPYSSNIVNPVIPQIPQNQGR